MNYYYLSYYYSFILFIIFIIIIIIIIIIIVKQSNVFLRLSHYSCLWQDRDISTATCKSSSGDGVDCEKGLLCIFSVQ